VGIVGAGQLARMTVGPAVELGVRLRVLAETPDDPAAQVVPATTVGDYRDLATLRAFAAQCDVVTFDHEHVPTEQAVHVYDRIAEAGKHVGLRHAGLKALASLRMEKGYRDYGHDIDNTDSVLEAGLGFVVDLDKPGGFIGRDAVVARRAAGPLTRRLLQVQLTDPEPLMFHAEVVRRARAAGGILIGKAQTHEFITTNVVGADHLYQAALKHGKSPPALLTAKVRSGEHLSPVESAMYMLEIHHPDVAITDIRMPPTHGLEGLEA
jgi:hypothetical protein